MDSSASQVLAAQIYSELVKVAMMKTTVTWSDLVVGLKLPTRGEAMQDAVNGALQTICKFDISNGRTPITAVLVATKQSPRMPGNGYFQLLDRLCNIKTTNAGRFDLWKEQLDKVHQEWSLPSEI